MKRNVYVYYGWQISHVPSNPVTGRWIAVHYGVEMCAGTLESLERMVVAKELDRQAWFI